VISINIYEIIMQIVNFFLLLWVLKLLVYKPLLTFLEKRQATIENNLAEAEKNKKEAEEILQEQKALLRQARLEAKNIRQKVEETSQKEREATRTKSNEEAALILVNAKKEISTLVLEAKADLLKKIGATSVFLAEKIMQKNLKEQDSKAIIENYLEDIK
jgi:F-type H+-transporting ATPase subunit b